ncbi:hypothetical protein BKA56DRAFT_673143 [Ilyonectria sp. MPI-CAGE-AT-0026]|nr:hypothetical protein BKA56DRAFT_673143 [Ilyonectria sp. MPI-CAGE-AT-0026]
MAKRLHNVFYWHEMYDGTGSTHGTSNSLSRGLNWVNLVTISKADLETGRHIACDGKSASSDIIDKADSIFPRTVSLADTPLTDDILSMPSDSEDVDYPEQNRIDFHFFKRLPCRLDLALQADAEAKTKNGPGGGDQATGSSTQGAPNRKRPRENGGSSGDESNNEGGHDQRQPKCPKAHQPNCPVGSKYLACPIWKLDPDKQLRRKSRPRPFQEQWLAI